MLSDIGVDVVMVAWLTPPVVTNTPKYLVFVTLAIIVLLLVLSVSSNILGYPVEYEYLNSQYQLPCPWVITSPISYDKVSAVLVTGVPDVGMYEVFTPSSTCTVLIFVTVHVSVVLVAVNVLGDEDVTVPDPAPDRTTDPLPVPQTV